MVNVIDSVSAPVNRAYGRDVLNLTGFLRFSVSNPDVEQNLLTKGVMIARIGSLLVAIATNLFLVGLFYSALINPIHFKDFIYKTGIMIFMIEFMSLHLSGMFFGAAHEEG